MVTRTGPVDRMTRQSKVTAKWKGSLGRSSNSFGAGLAKNYIYVVPQARSGCPGLSLLSS